MTIGYGDKELVPGLYEYWLEGDNRVEGSNCAVVLNQGADNESPVEMPYGEPFTFRFYEYHGQVFFWDSYNSYNYESSCNGYLFRVGD